MQFDLFDKHPERRSQKVSRNLTKHVWKGSTHKGKPDTSAHETSRGGLFQESPLTDKDSTVNVEHQSAAAGMIRNMKPSQAGTHHHQCRVEHKKRLEPRRMILLMIETLHDLIL